MIKLSEHQKNVLYVTREDKWIDENDSRIHKRTLNSLVDKGLLQYVVYVNRNVYQLTDKGLCEIDNLTKPQWRNKK